MRARAVVALAALTLYAAAVSPVAAQDLPVVRAAVVAQQLPGEQHVLGEDRLAVGEAGARIEAERDERPVVVGLDRPGEQAVERERLILPAGQQALDHVVADGLHRQSLHDEGIEAVEGTE